MKPKEADNSNTMTDSFLKQHLFSVNRKKNYLEKGEREKQGQTGAMQEKKNAKLWIDIIHYVHF